VNKFTWRLQRVLDVKQKQEDLQRIVLAGLSEHISRMREELSGRLKRMRQICEDIKKSKSHERIRQQQFTLQMLAFATEQLEKLRKELVELEIKKKAEIEKLLALRRYRLSLEKLRDMAKEQHLLEVKKFEQSATDDSVGISYARTLSEVGVS
jgi:flagellar export protein FliJ